MNQGRSVRVYNRLLGSAILLSPIANPCQQQIPLWYAMRLFQTAATLQLLAAQLVGSVLLETSESVAQSMSIDSAADPLDALAQLQQHAYDTIEQNEKIAKRAPKGCSLANTSVRRDW